MQRLIYFFLITNLFSCVLMNPIHKDVQQHRNQYKEGFLNNPRSPLQKEDLSKLSFYPPNKNFKVAGTFTASKELKVFDMPTYSGITRPYATYGIIEFQLNGRNVQMEVYKNMQTPANPLYANHLFLPFKDLTNGADTYGGGRYMDLKATDIVNNSVIIDFNKCYNPWCAYSDGYNCPVPPRFNHLDMEVTAGEKSFTGKYKQKK